MRRFESKDFVPIAETSMHIWFKTEEGAVQNLSNKLEEYKGNWSLTESGISALIVLDIKIVDDKRIHDRTYHWFRTLERKVFAAKNCSVSTYEI